MTYNRKTPVHGGISQTVRNIDQEIVAFVCGDQWARELPIDCYNTVGYGFVKNIRDEKVTMYKATYERENPSGEASALATSRLVRETVELALLVSPKRSRDVRRAKLGIDIISSE